MTTEGNLDEIFNFYAGKLLKLKSFWTHCRQYRIDQLFTDDNEQLVVDDFIDYIAYCSLTIKSQFVGEA